MYITQMSDLIKRSDAIKAVEDGMCTFYDCYVLDRINAIPSIDAVEVVRCKECKHRDPEDKKCDSGEFERAGCIFAVDDDYFCRYGERSRRR